MLVRHVRGEDPVRPELAEVQLDRFLRHEVNGDRVGAEGIEDDQTVFPVRDPREEESAVPGGDLHNAAGILQIREQTLVAGDPSHLGIDLVERDPASLVPVRGHRPRAESHHRHSIQPMAVVMVPTGWHRKAHIFQLPFYYVDYGLAQIGALQVWRNAMRDQARAVQMYRQALSLGGTRPLPELFAAAGARFAFDKQTLTELMALVEDTIQQLS